MNVQGQRNRLPYNNVQGSPLPSLLDSTMFVGEIEENLPPAQEEKPTVDIPLKHKHFQLLNSAMAGLRSAYDALGKIWANPMVHSILHNELLSSINTSLMKCYNALAGPMEYVKGFSAAGIIYSVPRFIKNVYKLVAPDKSNEMAWKRFNSAMKATQAFSIFIDSLVKTTICLETIQFSAKVAQKGFPLCEKIIKGVVEWSFPLCVFSWVLSYATLAVEITSLWKSQKFLVEYKKRNVKNININIIDICNAGNEKQLKRLQKMLLINNAEALKIKISGQNGEGQENSIRKIVGRLETTIKYKRLIVLIAAINFFLTPIIFISFFSFMLPIGYGLIGAYLTFTLINFMYRQITTYNFENEMGLIRRRPEDPLYNFNQNVNFVRRITDFSKWFFRFHTYIS